MKEQVAILHSKLTHPQVMGFVWAFVIFEALIIIFLLSYILSVRSPLEVSGSAQETIDQAITACLILPPADRPACARSVGVQVASYFSSPEERILQCMKLRPLWVRYCQEGLALYSPSPTPSPTSSPEPTPTATPTATPTESPSPTATP